MMQYRSVWISDVHLGTKMSNAAALLEFFKTFETDNLFLVGDIIDGWAMSKSFLWPQVHNDVIQKILRQARKGTTVTYLPGNHDEFLRSFGDHDFGNIRLVDTCVYRGANGLRYKVMHGDQFDVVGTSGQLGLRHADSSKRGCERGTTLDRTQTLEPVSLGQIQGQAGRELHKRL